MDADMDLWSKLGIGVHRRSSAALLCAFQFGIPSEHQRLHLLGRHLVEPLLFDQVHRLFQSLLQRLLPRVRTFVVWCLLSPAATCALPCLPLRPACGLRLATPALRLAFVGVRRRLDRTSSRYSEYAGPGTRTWGR